MYIKSLKDNMFYVKILISTDIVAGPSGCEAFLPVILI
jgi:hypothetical protein